MGCKGLGERETGGDNYGTSDRTSEFVTIELLWGTMSASVVYPLRGRQPEAPRTRDRSRQRSLTPEFHNKPVSVTLGDSGSRTNDCRTNDCRTLGQTKRRL
ncbi:hypothetical protein LSAT2_013159 [Lamellibrachia satsuma]|nr:hypothetical protein LSAT2_013159 [Lamellibrachia satsuma]